MIICTRRLEFDSAHRVMNHEGKCKMLHGHRYVLEASFSAKKLDELGRVIDFGVIREGEFSVEGWPRGVYFAEFWGKKNRNKVINGYENVMETISPDRVIEKIMSVLSE